MRISELSIVGVRGIRHALVLRADGRSVLVRGDNGTGKSSVARALQWALRGEGAPPAGAASGEEQFRRHVLSDPGDPRVEIRFVDGSTIVASCRGIETTGNAARYRESCARSSPFLRRSEILNVLADRPIDRFRYLQGYLDLEQADTLREQLANEAEQHRSSAERADTDKRRLLDPILPLFPEPLCVGATPTADSLHAALQAWSVTLRLSEPGERALVRDALNRAKALLVGPDLAVRRSQLSSAQATLSTVDAAQGSTLASQVQSALADVQRLERAAHDSAFCDMLEHARKHFAAADDGVPCPVCGQVIDRDAVVHALSTRLASLKSYSAARKTLNEMVSSWRAWWECFLSQAQNVREPLGVKSLLELEGIPNFPEGAESLLRSQRLRDEEFIHLVAAVDICCITEWATTVCAHLSAVITDRLQRLPPDESSNSIRAFAAAAQKFLDTSDAVRRLEAESVRGAQLARQLTTVSDAIRRARADVAQQLFDEIGETVTHYYSVVHPADGDDEPTAAPAIVVKRQREGTAYVHGGFNGSPVEDLRWVYSDGHLDTVGICIFLALRRFAADRGSSSKVLVLDDIIQSVDLAHARNLIKLLREEFSDHQLFLFTHNGLFAQWCADLSPGFKRIEVRRWTLERGPELGDHVSSMAALHDALDTETSPKLLAQSMMNLLDEWLVECRFAYRLSVRARRGEQYTLTELWEPFVKTMKAIEKGLGHPIPGLATLLEELKDVAKVRNALAAHENSFAREYPLETVRKIARASAGLVRMFFCFECNECAVPVPDTGENADMLRCRGRHILHTCVAAAPTVSDCVGRPPEEAARPPGCPPMRV